MIFNFILFYVGIGSILLKRWIAAESKPSAKKLRRQNTTVNDLVSSFRMGSGKEHEANESTDYGVCLLKDSPYRILRVSTSSRSDHIT